MADPFPAGRPISTQGSSVLQDGARQRAGSSPASPPPDLGLAYSARGIQDLRRGDRRAARHWAHLALQADPESESGWLLLAALAPPSRRSPYLRQVLQAHPASERARRALEEIGRPSSGRLAENVLASPLPLPAARTLSPGGRIVQAALRRLAEIGATLLLLAVLTNYGMILAERGRQGQPAEPLAASGEALQRTVDYFLHHPALYLWDRAETPSWMLVGRTFGHSAGLLLTALGLALVVGLGFGILTALAGRRGASTLAVAASITGISTPSFLLAMLLWVINIQVHRTFNVTVLPSVGFGWDAHLIMPALVLAARPIAQLARATHLSISDVLGSDFLRAARARGSFGLRLYLGHVLRLAWMPVLTTLGSSLRFSLSSLPVVELFFNWPGVGRTLIEALSLGRAPLVIDLILSLGVFFLIVNLALDMVYPILDPRLRQEGGEERKERGESLRGLIRLVWKDAAGVFSGILGRRHPRPRRVLPEGPLRPVPVEAAVASGRQRRILGSLAANLPLLVGGVLVAGVAAAAVSGGRWAAANPYQTHGVMMVEGTIGAPPYPPSSVFPWGSDYVGRDMQALVLNGGRQTLTLAFFAMLARLTLGAVLGMAAGWTKDSWLDRTIRSAIGIWAAFPGTLLAMILIQALGIQQGMGVFVVALCVVGWAEVAQVVRAEVLAIKARPFIEAARSIGLHAFELLRRHVFPNLAGQLLILAMLEMGGVLMLLAELGYLNIFLGGGFSAMIAETGAMVPVVVRYSDVPEWASLLANIRDWWRSYPWMAWSPGLAFCIAIFGFNFLGEGLRRFLETGFVSLSRVLNRYVALGVIGVAVALGLLLQASAPLSTYRAAAETFDVDKALGHIQILSSPDMQGRETGKPGAALAAQYIAMEMESIGLQPGYVGRSYLQAYPNPRPHFDEVPELTILDAGGGSLRTLTYHRDFAEYALGVTASGDAEAPVVGVSLGAPPGGDSIDPYGLSRSNLAGKVALIRPSDVVAVGPSVIGLLVVADDPSDLTRRALMPGRPLRNEPMIPSMVISRDVADALLRSAGSTLLDWEAAAADLPVGHVALTESGAQVRMTVPVTMPSNPGAEPYINVIGYLPGTGSEMGLDRQVVLVSAYYDGLGIAPDGTLYPGANDNASGVAALLELARALEQSAYPPERTVVFAAWAGGDRREGLSVDNIMNALGFTDLTVETVIELSGLGQGDGTGLSLGADSSYRLVQLFQRAAARFDVPTTTRGRGPHFGLPFSPGFGDRPGLTLFLSWDGSDTLAHTPLDSFERIEPEKLRQAGETTLLSLFVLSRESTY